MSVQRKRTADERSALRLGIMMVITAALIGMIVGAIIKNEPNPSSSDYYRMGFRDGIEACLRNE